LISGTGPAVSSGASTQPYQFFDQGFIAPADNLYTKMQESGLLDDYQPGVFDTLHYQGSLVAVPWCVDLLAYWYRPSLLEKAGAQVPTTWDELRETGLKLKQIGVSGYGVSPTQGASQAKQFLTLALSNDAPLIDDDGNINCMSERFIEATEFCLSLAKDGIVKPEMVSYDSANLMAEIGNGNVAIAALNGSADSTAPAEIQDDFEVMPPMTAPSGSKWNDGMVQTLMMYTNTPSQDESEAFLAWYLENMKVYWEKKAIQQLPVLKSITETIKDLSPKMYQVASEYVPLIKGVYGKNYSEITARYDGTPSLVEWGQKVTQGAGNAKELCESLQKSLEQLKAEG
jgi:multiple sugar transport system substrate-binding protein